MYNEFGNEMQFNIVAEMYTGYSIKKVYADTNYTSNKETTD